MHACFPILKPDIIPPDDLLRLQSTYGSFTLSSRRLELQYYIVIACLATLILPLLRSVERRILNTVPSGTPANLALRLTWICRPAYKSARRRDSRSFVWPFAVFMATEPRLGGRASPFKGEHYQWTATKHHGPFFRLEGSSDLILGHPSYPRRNVLRPICLFCIEGTVSTKGKRRLMGVAMGWPMITIDNVLMIRYVWHQRFRKLDFHEVHQQRAGWELP